MVWDLHLVTLKCTRMHIQFNSYSIRYSTFYGEEAPDPPQKEPHLEYCGDHGAGCRVRRKGFCDFGEVGGSDPRCVGRVELFMCGVKGLGPLGWRCSLVCFIFVWVWQPSPDMWCVLVGWRCFTLWYRSSINAVRGRAVYEAPTAEPLTVNLGSRLVLPVLLATIFFSFSLGFRC